MREKFLCKGHWKIEAIDKETGKILQKIESDNLIVNTGKIAIASNLKGHSMYGSTPYIQIGTNGDAPSLEDTGLNALYRSQVNSSRTWDAVNKKVIIWTTFTDFVESGHICEAGLMCTELFNRVNFDPAIDFSPTINIRVTLYIIP